MRKILNIIIIVVIGYFAYQYFGPPPSLEPGEVIIFIADDCEPCNMSMAFLNRNHVKYTICNISKSEDNYKKFKRFKGNYFPLILSGKERVEGYDETLLNIFINGLKETTDSKNTRVVMYSRQGCEWCVKAREYFQEHDIDYTEYDINASERNMAKYNAINGFGTPIIFIGNNRIEGFNIEALDMALKQIGLL